MDILQDQKMLPRDFLCKFSGKLEDLYQNRELLEDEGLSIEVRYEVEGFLCELVAEIQDCLKTVMGQFGEESLAAAELRRMLAEDPTISWSILMFDEINMADQEDGFEPRGENIDFLRIELYNLKEEDYKIES